MPDYEGRWKTVKVEIEQGIAGVTFNRPEKRNAWSRTGAEADSRRKEHQAWSAGLQALKEIRQ